MITAPLSLLISVRLLALKPIILRPLHHPAIDNNPRLRLFWLHDAIVCHAPAIFATVVCQPLLAPYVCFCFPFDLDLIWFVVSPEGAVATADGAEAFVGGFTEGWKGDADGFAVAGYLELGLLGGIGCHGGGGLWQVGKVEATCFGIAESGKRSWILGEIYDQSSVLL